MKIKSLSAIGNLIIAHPCMHDPVKWEVVQLKPSGRWCSGSRHANKEDALKRRAELFKLHRKLASERRRGKP